MGPGRTEAAVDRLCEALAAGAARGGWRGPPAMPGYEELTIDMAMPPNEAATGPARAVPLERAAGAVAAEFAVPYPPGVPRLIPGQRLGPAQVAFLVGQREMGALVKGQADATLETLRVVV